MRGRKERDTRARKEKNAHRIYPAEERKERAQRYPHKHLPMLWSVFEESKEAKGKSGVVTWDRLALVLQGDTSHSPPPPTPFQSIYEPITTSVVTFFCLTFLTKLLKVLLYLHWSFTFLPWFVLFDSYILFTMPLCESGCLS